MARSCCNNSSTKESEASEPKDVSTSIAITCCASNEDDRLRTKDIQSSCCSKSTSEIAGTSIQTESSLPKEEDTCCSTISKTEEKKSDTDPCCSSGNVSSFGFDSA